MKRDVEQSVGPTESEGPEPSPQKVLVVFTGVTRVRWLQLLRRGFRHCFAIIVQDDLGILYDPLSNRTIIAPLAAAVTIDELLEYSRAGGFTAIEASVRGSFSSTWLLRPFTCVEAVKRLLGIDAPLVVTPWQLYRLLARREQCKDLDNSTAIG